MSSWKIAFKLLKDNPARNAVYMISQYLVSSMMFLLFNLMSNTVYDEIGLTSISVTLNQESIQMGNIFSLMAFVAALYAVIMDYYVASVFYSTEDRAFVTFSLSGYTPSKLTYICFLQYLILGVTSITAGMGSARFIFVPALDRFIYARANIEGPVGAVFYEARLFTLLLQGSVSIAVMLDRLTKFSGMTVYDILEGNQTVSLAAAQHTSTLNKSVRYVIFYVAGLLLCLIMNHPNTPVYAGLFGLIGCIGILRQTLPWYLKKVREGIENHRALLIISYLSSDLNESSLSCFLLLVASVFCTSTVTGSRVSFISYLISCLALTALVSMISVLLFARFFTKLKERQRTLDSVNLLGYRLKDELMITLSEIALFYLILLALPGVYCLAMIVKAVTLGNLLIENALTLLLAYTAPLMVSMILVLLFYYSRIRKNRR